MVRIAIDGPGGAGKSSVAKAVAKELGIIYVDTGALYRTIGYFVRSRDIDPHDEEKVGECLKDITIEVGHENGTQIVYLNGENLGDKIRTPEMSMYASAVSAIPAVRAFLLETQKDIARKNSDSVDGIDVSDLSKLKDLFNSIDEKYTIETQTYFNFEAVKIINKTYNTDYKQRNIKTVTNDQDNQEAFTLFDVNSTYVETYGATRVEYSPTYIVDYLGWTRIGENKYKCDRVEVVEHFRQLLTPGLSNEGTYMTYDYITIQINNDGSLTIRLYCSNTQSGKIINEHNDQNNKPQWYMLLAEGTIKDIE